MSSWLAFQRLAPSIAAILPLALAIFAYERALIPIYASAPTSRVFNKIVLASLSLGFFQPWMFTVSQKAFACAVFLALAPNAAYWIPVWSARNRDPLWGPAVTHCAILLPLVATMSSFLQRSESRVLNVASTITVFFTLTQARSVLGQVSLLNSVSESQIFLSLSFIYTCITILQLPVAAPVQAAPKKRKQPSSLTPFQTRGILMAIFLALSSSIYPNLRSPVLPHPLKELYTHPSSLYKYIPPSIVGESLNPAPNASERDQTMSNVRYLRAAHSILGGVWMGPKIMSIDNVPPIRDSYGTPLGDSIYGAFTLQEAARLVNSTAKGPENVLIMQVPSVHHFGLGIGVSATAFQRHKMPVTIVEIDPAVYDAARRFFGLPDPGEGKVFLEDARGWVARTRADVEGVPDHIFTVEFWQDLKNIMQPEGILVVNYAGHLMSDSMRMVAGTLLKTFGQCRAFHDLIQSPTKEQLENDFMNIAFFCTSSIVPLTFRKATNEDYLGSALRRHCLSNMDHREIDLKSILSSIPEGKEAEYVLTDAHNPLGKLQEEQGDHHWMLMREVLTDIYWETY
ncbi:hypothetical protein CPB85DRAFT_1375038 [Mucidula mucida]|nr:hypothetical protein CPB85DRAFT_1375038 [Mucidula mucida]